jgi:hypothetical protein
LPIAVAPPEAIFLAGAFFFIIAIKPGFIFDAM